MLATHSHSHTHKHTCNMNVPAQAAMHYHHSKSLFLLMLSPLNLKGHCLSLLGFHHLRSATANALWLWASDLLVVNNVSAVWNELCAFRSLSRGLWTQHNEGSVGTRNGFKHLNVLHITAVENWQKRKCGIRVWCGFVIVEVMFFWYLTIFIVQFEFCDQNRWKNMFSWQGRKPLMQHLDHRS